MKTKLAVVLVTVYAFVFMGLPLVRADDLSEMKDQIKVLQETINAQQKTIDALNSKVQGVAAKQESQANEVRQVPELAKQVDELKSKPSMGGLFEGTSVGGHLKVFLLDRTQAERNQQNQHNSLSAGMHTLYLYFTKDISDWLKMDVQTTTSVSTGATPALGSDTGRTQSPTVSTSIHQAFFSAMLPKGLEARAGVFNPMFSEEYAKETWYAEYYTLAPGACNLQSWHDSGVELYKNIDFDKWSLPAYLSVHNGALVTPRTTTAGDTFTNSARFADNNDDKTIMMHIAPEFFQTKLRLLGSFAFGKWDSKGKNMLYQSLGGVDWKYKKLNLTGEYISRLFKHLNTLGTASGVNQVDGEIKGYWLKGVYDINDKWRTAIKVAHAELFKTGVLGMRSDNYDDLTLALDYKLTPNSVLIAQYQLIDTERSDMSESLKAHRSTLGWRTTF